ncbi:hypothetical protein D918_02745 [Trichuris suis]|nr:hypothetical protein D918_02745 [Trichuris suis]
MDDVLLTAAILCRKVGKYREVLITDQEGKEHTNGPLPMFYESSMQSGKRYGRSEPSAEGYFSSLVKPEFKKKCNSETFRLALRFSREVPQIYHEYIPHLYATDNAWVTGRIHLVRVEREPCYSSIDLTQPANYLHYKWKRFNGSAIRSASYLTEYAHGHLGLNSYSNGTFAFGSYGVCIC